MSIEPACHTTSLLPITHSDGTEAQLIATHEEDSAVPTSPDEVVDESAAQADAFLGCIPMYLGEFMARESPGCPNNDINCMSCKAPGSASAKIFRCLDCNITECTECCIARHIRSPLHAIEEWSGAFWRKVQLEALGLVLQLGHGGSSCSSPSEVVQPLCIVDISGIHTVNVLFCRCDLLGGPSPVQQLLRFGWYPATTERPKTCATFAVLALFRQLSIKGKISPVEFVSHLCKLRSGPLPNVDADDHLREEFTHMSRQYNLLTRLKRTGLGQRHSTDNIGCGASAVLCWACPHEGKNLLDSWRNLAPNERYLCATILSIGANLRLGPRMNASKESSLVPGNSYFVNRSSYEYYIESTADAPQADTSKTRSTGIAGSICTRHGVVRSQGIGLLQGKERFSNMDYIFASSVKDLQLPLVFLSYDSACRWSTHFMDRAIRLPEELRPSRDTSLIVLADKNHRSPLVKHRCPLRTLQDQAGVGATDGDALQRFWARFDGGKSAVQEMSDGEAADFFDDAFDHHNFLCNMTIGIRLKQRREIAMGKRHEYTAHFRTIDQLLPPDLRQSWTAQAESWERGETDRNPHLSWFGEDRGVRPIESRDIVNNIIQEELRRVSGTQHTRPLLSRLGFLIMGLELEEIQRNIRQDIDQIGSEELKKRRESLSTALTYFRFWQRVYMADVSTTTPEDGLFLESDSLPEKVKLWLPSDFYHTLPDSLAPLAELELELRAFQLQYAMNAIAELKAVLPLEPNAANEIQTLLAEVVTAYSDVRFAFISLTGNPDRFPAELHNINGRFCKKSFYSGAFQADLFLLAGEVIRERQDPYVDRMLDYLRITWTKSKAKRDRWIEEIAIIEEEMARVLRFLDWEAIWWQSTSPREDALTGDVAFGQRAYAARKVAFFHSLSSQFMTEWGI